MTRARHPAVKVLFVAKPEHRNYAADIGDFLPLSAATAEVMAVVERMVRQASGGE
jgi:hypothetical protein